MEIRPMGGQDDRLAISRIYEESRKSAYQYHVIPLMIDERWVVL